MYQIMIYYTCHDCKTTSNRKFNMRRHIFRKHPGARIPDNLFHHSKAGIYSCPFCNHTSNRKFNMKEHIVRKHPEGRVPDNLRSYNNDFSQSSLLSSKTTSFTIIPAWPIYPNYVDASPQLITDDTRYSRKKTYNNFFFKIILETLKYNSLIQNQPVLQIPYFYHNNDFLNPSIMYYEPLSNIDFGQPFLFKVYKCPICFGDIPIMFSTFEQIKTTIEHRFNCSLLPSTTNEAENKNNIDPKIKKFAINKILSIINKKIYPQAKLYLKSIFIPTEMYQILNFEGELNYNDQSSENNNTNVPNWLRLLLIYEKFSDIEDNNEENSWASRLISSNNNSIEITREELIQFINLSNSTFGFFKLQKNPFITYYFFIYLQLEKI